MIRIGIALAVLVVLVGGAFWAGHRQASSAAQERAADAYRDTIRRMDDAGNIGSDADALDRLRQLAE